MDLEQNLFLYFFNFKKRKKEKFINSKKNEFTSVKLEDIKGNLFLFSSAIFNLNMEIRSTDDFPYLSGNKIFLPPFINTEKTIELNYLFYKLIIMHLYAQKSLIKMIECKSLDEELLIIKNEKNKMHVFLQNCFPNYSQMLDELTSNWIEESKTEEVLSNSLNRNILWGRLQKSTFMINAQDAESITKEALPDPKTEMEKKKSGRINKINLEEDKENIGQDVFHHFEKVETLEEYKGIQRDFDGQDELQQHADALDDLNIEEVVRSSKQTQSIYKTEMDLGFEVSDLESTDKSIGKYFEYDEWDGGKKAYKKNWCKIYHEITKPKKIDSNKKSLLSILETNRSEVDRLKKRLIQLSSEVKIKKKLLDGRLIDIDNFVKNQTMIVATKNGDGRYYQEIIKRHRDMCTLLLVDSSLSSDSWVKNKRILDLSLESLLIFGESEKQLEDKIMVAGFNSNTRNSCKFIQWKSFEESWDVFKDDVDHIVPEGYTRIGPAIRHATHILSKRKEKHKLLLIFTDGRPTDYDRYEGAYGLSDVRKAINEAELEGIIPFAIAVDPTAKQYLPNLFGKNNYQILNNIQKLPEILMELYIKMAKGC